MKCPECQNDMITAKNGHMCLNCGYAESVDPHKTPLVPEDKAAPEVKPVADSPTPVVAEVKPLVEAASAPNTTANSLEDQVKLDIVNAVDAVEKSAGTAEPLAAEPAPLEVVPEPAAAAVVAADIIKTTGRSKVQAKTVDSMAPQGRTKGTLDLKPSREDLVKGAASVSAVDAIGPALAEPEKVIEVEPEPDKAVEDPTPVHVIDHAAEALPEPTPEPTPEPETAPEPTPEAVPVVEPIPTEPVPAASETPVPAAEPAVSPILQTAPAVKEPLIAKTHPEASSAKTVMMVVGALVIVTCATVAAYYFTSNKNTSKVGENASVSKETPAAGNGESAAVLDKTATPSATPTATPDASSAQARDLKRKTDLAAYAASVKAAATNGYYPTAAPAVSGAVVDPTTGKSYAVATTPAASLGAIQYLAGGKCGAASVTPGKTSTRYISLSTKLETDTAPYCIDVK